MRYFQIDTIKQAIEGLQDYNVNWLLPAFVFAANDIGEEALVNMSEGVGTDQFLDRYFNGDLIGLSPLPRGNNLLRPRLKGVTWNRGPFADDFVIQQDTKMWGNLFSSRGYREMRMQGLIDGTKAIVKLTPAFRPRFEEEIPETFHFENLLVWLYAFDGVPDEVNSWQGLFDDLLAKLNLQQFKPAYQGRFRLSDPPLPWPELLANRPTNDEFLTQLAPKLAASIAAPPPENHAHEVPAITGLSADDPVLTAVIGAIQADESLAFLLAGPPGTGKTHHAKRLALALTENDPEKILTLQFHPAIGYDDFIEGFRPRETQDGQGIRYELAPRLFLSFASKAAAAPENRFVVVIDELNRGDVARIFGEVLTYLEFDYREQEFTLPFSGKLAKLPKNLVLIATANPYDRSVTDLDDALLRRFWVIEIEPDAAILRNHLESHEIGPGIVNRTMQVFSILNNAFPNGFGHTNFLRVQTIDDLAAVWTGRVRLALRRALIHDRPTYDATVASIEALLQTAEEAEPPNGPPNEEA